MVLSLLKAACRGRNINLIMPALLLIIMMSCNTHRHNDSLPFYNTADFTAEWITNDAAPIHTIDSFSMVNQQGHIFNSDSLKGKIYVACFFFTSCGSICPKMMFNIKKLQDSFSLEDKVRIVSFSVMPSVDSVGKLAAYGKNMGIDPAKWMLLTGDKARINTLGRQSFFAEKKEGLQKDANEFMHTETMLLIDKKARIRGVYNATEPGDIARASEDIRILLKE